MEKKLENIMVNILTEILDEALEEPAKISIENKNSTANIRTEGSPLAVLLTLAGLEKSILKELNPPEDVWKMIKECIGVRGDNNEQS